ncbi:MAG: RidA family protein [Alphaproteobacteria bacterium]|nr:RidA family protein [Alphaproteobacteria bacterium]
MSDTYGQRLAELGIVLPEPVAPQANYVPYVVAGDFVYIAGQIPLVDGKPGFIGRLGDDLNVEDGQAAARACGLSIIAHLKAALDGDLNAMKRCVKLGGFVACTPDFGEQPVVVNGASDLMVDVFGDAGRHARFAVGAQALPFGVAVEVDAIFIKS